MTIPKINLEPDPIYKSKLHRKAMNSYITLMIIASIGIGGYAQATDDLKQRQSQPIVAQAQQLTASSGEIVQTASIEPLKPDSLKFPDNSDRATRLNAWIAKKQPNSPLNNSNFDTGKILIEIEEETKVKAELILAKAYQETKLGTVGVCKRNAGSVGETDSDRKLGKFCQDFRSENQAKSIDRMEHYQTDDYLYKSLRAIANTMNNQYLGSATVLCQLSKGYKGCTDDQVKIMHGQVIRLTKKYIYVHNKVCI